jgi:hypothetical protein
MFVATMTQNTQIAPPAAPAAHVTQPNGTPAVVDPKLGLPQTSETGVNAEPTSGNDDDEDDADFWKANEIQDVHEM